MSLSIIHYSCAKRNKTTTRCSDFHLLIITKLLERCLMMCLQDSIFQRWFVVFIYFVVHLKPFQRRWFCCFIVTIQSSLNNLLKKKKCSTSEFFPMNHRTGVISFVISYLNIPLCSVQLYPVNLHSFWWIIFSKTHKIISCLTNFLSSSADKSAPTCGKHTSVLLFQKERLNVAEKYMDKQINH